MAVMISLACSGVLHFKTVGSGNGVFKGVQGDPVCGKLRYFYNHFLLLGKANFIWETILKKILSFVLERL